MEKLKITYWMESVEDGNETAESYIELPIHEFWKKSDCYQPKKELDMQKDGILIRVLKNICILQHYVLTGYRIEE